MKKLIASVMCMFLYVQFLFAQSICPSVGLNTSFEYIQSVSFNATTISSGDNSGKHVHEQGILLKQSSLFLTLTPGHHNEKLSREYWSVWMDVNNDGQISENELLANLNGLGAQTIEVKLPKTISSVVPLRIAMQYSSYPKPCEDVIFGEIEDYTIILNDNCAFYYHETFNNGYGNWTDGGDDCTLVDDHTINGSTLLRLRDNSSESYIILDKPNFPSDAKIEMSFSYKVHSFENDESFIVEINRGSGFELVEKLTVGHDFRNSKIYNKKYTLENPSQIESIRIRSKASSNGDQVYIDDIILSNCTEDDHKTDINADKLVLDNKFSTTNKIKTNFLENDQFTIGPNPSVNFVDIINHDKIEEETFVTVEDYFGNIWIENKLDKNSHKKRIDISSLPKGNYILSLYTTEHLIYREKLFIFK